ncbi:beta-propeller fold lactonase family protein [Neisseriaceae bacterium TC5R-5]|nr:beta-propeller fold lactonase family protein [Neisseriaceae bacterium TC5R-5]
MSQWRKVVSVLSLWYLGSSAVAATPIIDKEGLLTDEKGMALYIFDKDVAGSGSSVCKADCAALWPPLLAGKEVRLSSGFSLIQRDDGTQQWAYRGKPLYLFSKDQQAGDHTGDQVKNVWHLAKRDAEKAVIAFDAQISNNTLAVNPAETLALAAKSGSAKVLVYDLRSGQLRQELTGFISPRNIVFAPNGETFYVSDSSKGVIERWNAQSLQKEATLAVGPGAFGTAIDKQGQRLYVNNQASNTVTVLNLAQWRAEKVITGFAQPRQGVKLSPDGQTLFVTNFLGDKITVVDTDKLQPIADISGFNKIRAISISADGKTLFAANSGADTLSWVDLASKQVIKSVKVGKDPYGAALRPDGRFLYAGNLKSNSLTVVALPAFNVNGEITGLRGPRQAISFSRDSSTAWVLNEDLSIAEVDLSRNKIVRELIAAAR